MIERLDNEPEEIDRIIRSTEYLIDSAIEREQLEEATDWARLRAQYRELAGFEPDELDINIREYDEGLEK